MSTRTLGMSADGGAPGQGEFAKSKKQRRAAAKAARALLNDPEAAAAAEAAKNAVPVFEQSINLPSAGPEAIRAREKLKIGMRVAGRKKVKEQNFLRGMA